MSEDRYRVLQDAITKARPTPADHHGRVDWSDERNAHLDTLAAILDRHTVGRRSAGACDACLGSVEDDWPCPDVLTVETALRNMGALT